MAGNEIETREPTARAHHDEDDDDGTASRGKSDSISGSELNRFVIPPHSRGERRTAAPSHRSAEWAKNPFTFFALLQKSWSVLVPFPQFSTFAVFRSRQKGRILFNSFHYYSLKPLHISRGDRLHCAFILLCVRGRRKAVQVSLSVRLPCVRSVTLLHATSPTRTDGRGGWRSGGGGLGIKKVK